MPFQMVGKSAPSWRAALHRLRSAWPGSSMLGKMDRKQLPNWKFLFDDLHLLAAPTTPE
jgi:hypothetical protein